MKVDRLFSKNRTAARRPFDIIRADFSERGIVLRGVLDRGTLGRLSAYPHLQYRGLLEIVDKTRALVFLDKIRIDEASLLKDLDLHEIAGDHKFLKGLPDGRTLDLTGLRLKWAVHLKENGFPQNAPVSAEPPSHERGPEEAPFITPRKTFKVLTHDLMFKPDAPYPESPIEYREMIRGITTPSGVFPDDSGAPPAGYIVPPGQKGVKTYSLVRKGKPFTAQFFNPEEHALNIRNRLIFTFDLLSQRATLDAYGIRGCSYDRVSYCERRYFASDRVGIILYEGMPVSFAAVTQYETFIEGNPLKYVFIHVVMTMSGVRDISFQRMGLTSYLIREIGSSMFYRNIWENEHKNPHVDPDGNLANERFKVWAAAHSGRASVFHAFSTSFLMAPSEMRHPDAVRKVIVESADEKITGRRGGRALYPVRADVFRDEAIYPPSNRYQLDENGNVKFPPSERKLSTFPEFSRLMGGDAGPKGGDAIYMVGEITLDRIRAAKKREKMREGSGRIEGAIDDARGWVISHLKP